MGCVWSALTYKVLLCRSADTAASVSANMVYLLQPNYAVSPF